MKRNMTVLVLVSALVILILSAGIRTISPVSLLITDGRSPVLILDAGHGGEDGGASTAAGDKESDINLAIVLKMEVLFAFLGVETVLTRDADISIYDEGCKTIREKKVSDLKNRASLVQNTPNAMLLSVHQNTFTDSRYHGAQVFFGADERSVQWGEYTQRLLCEELDPSNSRSATTVPEHVYLFRNVDCPAILVECGFLSNGEDAALLLTDMYQRKLAAVLVGAYFHQLQMIPKPLGGE